MDQVLKLQEEINRLNKELESERAFTRRYLNLGNSFIVIVNKDEKIHLINRTGLEILGYTKEEVTGQNWFDLVIPSDISNQQKQRFREMMATRRSLFRKFSEFPVITKTGDVKVMNWSIGMLESSDGAPIGQILSGQDITEERAAKKEVEWMAYHDSLTKLYNRTYLDSKIDEILDQAKRQDWAVGLLFLDFDNFKACNDEYGHEYGDELLRQIAIRLQSIIRPSDILVRLGGDEFVIVLTELDLNQAAARHQSMIVANRIKNDFAQEFNLTVKERTVTHSSAASIGISLFPYDAPDYTTLLKLADNAMYQAKKQGKNRFIFISDV